MNRPTLEVADIIGAAGKRHPHVHCVIPAGGLASDHSRYPFFLPVKVLSRVFRGKFVAGLKSACHRNKLEFHGPLKPLADPKAFARWLRQLFRTDWVVYAKPPFGGPQHVLHYLARYTHRVAIRNRQGPARYPFVTWSRGRPPLCGVATPSWREELGLPKLL